MRRENAMPFYFAYGSCMNQEDLARSGVQATYVETAVLRNYRLAFSRYSTYRGGGVADIVREPGEFVEGVLYEVADFHALDRREGAPFVYRRRKVRVYPKSLGGRWRWAWTYEVVEKSPVEIAPSREYALLIWEGAKVLSKEYRKKLKENLLGRMGEFL
jgi:cation transport regulator ChaC